MRRALQATLLAAALAAGAQPAGAAAPPPGLTPDQQAEFGFLADVIGPEHAQQHMTRQVPQQPGVPPQSNEQFDPCRPRGPATRYESRPLPPKDVPTGQARCGKLPRQPRTPAKLARQGRWSTQISDLPHYAIHAALLETGKVIFWGFEWTQRLITRTPTTHQVTSSNATLWNPRTRGTRAVLPPRIDVDGDGIPEHVPLYCSSQTTLPDGRLLVTGGTLDLLWAQHGYTQPPGLKIVLIFDPKTETWSRSPDMKVARWYPTAVKLADGRTLVLAGFDDQKPTNLTRALEVVSPDGRTVTAAPSGDKETWTYPGMVLMPDARVLLAGPRTQDTGLLDPKTLTWAPVAPLPSTRGGENLVPVPTRTGSSPQAMVLGGADFVAQAGGVTVPAYKSTLVFDARNPGAGWRSASPLNSGRNWPNTVLLPDGSMVIVGGGSAITGLDAGYASDGRDRHVELWDPKTKRWRFGAAQREDRTYHSVALLLPDGRVWSAGDDANPNRDGDTAEFYEPPYLFRGKRPRIVRGPRTIAPGRDFSLTVRGEVPARVTLLAPGNTTHGRDMNQRFAELKVRSRKTTGDTTVLRVRGPRGSAVAPPGPYMLFALSERDAPSVARWTRVR
ncbi:MAG TPA: galactose oxidase-like domain-containing protein [Solirubrobacteraceae bacterium]